MNDRFWPTAADSTSFSNDRFEEVKILSIKNQILIRSSPQHQLQLRIVPIWKAFCVS